MSHPLTGRDFRSQLLPKRAAVQVERVPPYALKVVVGGFVIAKEQVWATVATDKRLKVIGPDGEPIEPTGEFLISTETFDPFHLVTDYFEGAT